MASNSAKTEQRAFILLLVAMLAIGAYLLWPFVQTLLMSGILAVLFYPLHNKILRWLKGRQNLAALASVFAVILFIFIPIAVLLMLVTTQLASLVASSNIEISQSTFSGLLASVQQKAAFWVAKFEYVSGLDFDLVPWIQRGVTRIAQTLAQYSPAVLAGTANVFLHLFIMVIVMYYFFRDGSNFFDLLIKLSPVKDQYERRLAKEIRDTINGVFYGNFMTGLVQAILSTFGYYFAGIPAYFVWGVITFFMSFLPMLGTGIVIIPLIIALLVQGKIQGAVILGVFGIVIGMADNVLRPMLTRSNMHPLILFLSFFGGLAVFGPIGILVGPMVMAMLTATVRIYSKDFTAYGESKLERG
ncbi:MAG TPA: AI-2E family transporter [bacterium]|nr:AI-2E family transporter [bacterium]